MNIKIKVVFAFYNCHKKDKTIISVVKKDIKNTIYMHVFYEKMLFLTKNNKMSWLKTKYLLLLNIYQGVSYGSLFME